MARDEIENRNYQYIQELNDAYLDRRLIVFYGAGLSMQLGLPSWSELIKYVIDRVIESPCQREELLRKIDTVDFWEAMECVKEDAKVNEANIKSLIAKCIKDKQDNIEAALNSIDNNYKDLAESNLSFFMTTNYDTFLEKMDSKCMFYDIDMLEDQANADLLKPNEKKKKIFYLHGHINKVSSIVITKEAVEGIYQNENWISFFETLLSEYHILFIGASLDDKYLRKFLEKSARSTQNSYYVISDKHKEIDCKVIVLQRKKKLWVNEIRDILEKIKRKPMETVWIRVMVDAADQEQFVRSMKRVLKSSEDVNIEFLSDSQENYIIIMAMHMKKSATVEMAFKNYKVALRGRGQAKYGVEDYKTTYFYSCNEYIFFKKDYDSVFKHHMLLIMQKRLNKESSGYIIDINGLKDGDCDPKMINKIMQMQLSIEPEGDDERIPSKDYKFYADESISIKGAITYGVEVHVSGFCFFGGRLLMENRSHSTAIAPDRIAPVGGRMRTGEDFVQALERHFRDDCNLKISDVTVCNTFKTFNSNVPGLSFVCNSNGSEKNNGRMKTDCRLYTKEELLQLYEDDRMACDKGLLMEAFGKALGIRKKTIKLRVILWSNCCYCCKGCHHENLNNRSIIYNANAVMATLKRLGDLFDVRQITITGGEPLEGIGQLVSLIKNIKKCMPLTDVAVITNGEKLNKQVVQQLIKYNVRYKISLYGYDNDSFETYTGCKSYRKGDYLGSFQEKLQFLNERNIRYTVNIPVHKYIANGLGQLLCSDVMQDTLLSGHSSKVKIIDMVKPRGEETDTFHDLYVPLETVKQELQGVLENGCSEKFARIKDKINYFVYPCKSCTGPNEECFEEFALTIEPDGKLLVCKSAVEKLCFGDKDFEEYMRQNGVEVEFAEYDKDYGNSSIIFSGDR